MLGDGNWAIVSSQMAESHQPALLYLLAHGAAWSLFLSHSHPSAHSKYSTLDTDSWSYTAYDISTGRPRDI